MRHLSAVTIASVVISSLVAAEKELSVEELAAAHRKSIAVITVEGRDGKQHGIGTGFIVSKDGLIATNMHVIGEGRAVRVELADGRKFVPTFVHATQRSADLAVLRIDAKDLPALYLGDSDKLKDGQPVVVLGNPQGLKHSVVSGVVSGRRELDGRSMIQLAIPVEPGNSGGPLLDRSGKVQGIVTLKSAVTQNLGFAMPVNALKPLLEKPNPVAMSKWLTFGALDPEDWATVFGARWRHRSGRILVDGAGQGFGGRALCLSKQPAPETPFEIAVSVKLDDEAGAAGLAFHADGGDKHYGFYPSNGELRLTRFDGADVFTWKILAQRRSEHYRPGTWNTLKVRIEKGKLICFVNEHLVVEIADDGLTSGKVGLAKFRETEAEFKQFQVSKRLAVDLSPDTAKRVKQAVSDLQSANQPTEPLAESLRSDAASIVLLREHALALENQAKRLRELAQSVHRERVCDQLSKLAGAKNSSIDLVDASLLIAQLDNDELDMSAYRKEFDRLASRLTEALPKKADDEARIAALNRFFFEDRGFHGSRGDYYHRSNSYLNEVIDDREGLPITLSILYIELARKIGLKMEGVGLPGHFVVRAKPAGKPEKLIDVYDGGKTLTREEAAKKVESTAGVELTNEHLKAVAPAAIVVRVLHNLLNLARDERDVPGALRYLSAIVAIQPDAGPERWMRAVIGYQMGLRTQARQDVEWLLEKKPSGVEIRNVRELQRLLDGESR
jgi:regulator of sirC expression with transglutaminase-like and TPR domain